MGGSSDSSPSWEGATRDQYDDDTNLAARQALFAYLVDATPMPPPLDDMSVLEGHRVLDVGCGNGAFLASAARAGATAAGIDLSMGLARQAATEAGTATAQADAIALPVRDDTIDTVLALWMLYHVPDKTAALEEFARVLRPGGAVIISTNSGADPSLDALACGAIGDVLGHKVARWHAPLNFTSENGEGIVRSVFPEATTHPFGTRFEVDDPEVLVRYVGSMLDPIQDEHGTLPVVELLAAVGRRAEAELERHGSIRIDRSGAVFIATA